MRWSVRSWKWRLGEVESDGDGDDFFQGGKRPRFFEEKILGEIAIMHPWKSSWPKWMVIGSRWSIFEGSQGQSWVDLDFLGYRWVNSNQVLFFSDTGFLCGEGGVLLNSCDLGVVVWWLATALQNANQVRGSGSKDGSSFVKERGATSARLMCCPQWCNKSANTVDGWNPAPPGMYETLKIMG